MIKLKIILSLTLVLVSLEVNAENYHLTVEGKKFIAYMEQEHNFEAIQVEQALQHATKQQSILDAVSRPAEKIKTWAEYRPIFLTNKRINGGVKFWQENATTLERAEQEYGVPAQIIVAILGVETFYGSNTGKYLVLDSLATLGFDYPPRATFFKSELEQFFLLAREQQFDLLQIKGSYAGAMGLAQFISSSYRDFAVDFDGDGKINLWDVEDAIGSIANYLKAYNWHPNERIALTINAKDFLMLEEGSMEASINPSITGEKIRHLGWTGFSDPSKDYPMMALQLKGENGLEYWLGLPNFYVITRYNRNHMYALAVYQLSEEILNAYKFL